jgi:7-keto-8-aminopelargonate synthetase-like enzyme
VYTTASPPAIAAATIEALRIAATEPERRTRLRAAACQLRTALRIDGQPDGHIVPITLGDADRTMRTAAALRDRGFLVGAVRPPTVPDGTSRLRLTLSAAHQPADIDALVAALECCL